MTCIVGIAKEGTVYIGADRGVSDDYTILTSVTPKVFVKGEWIFAYSGSLGTGQLMQFISFPEVEDQDPFLLLRLDIMEALKGSIEAFGNPVPEHAAEFLIGCKGRLFEFSTEDWNVLELTETALGSGGSFALGSLHTTSQYEMALPIYRIECALNAAITLSPSCQGPMDVLFV
jgi:ATP-dependent protease HslVU (ClpYQ) peptidase subunit